jgi:hypothetical protein
MMKYILLVQHYMNKHRELNYQIAKLNDLTGPRTEAFVSKNMEEVLSLGSTSNPRRNQTSEDIARTTVLYRDTMLLNRVVALKEGHMHLYDISGLLNSAYGFQILLCFPFLFVEGVLGYNFGIDLILKALGGKDGIATDIQDCNALCLALLSSSVLTFLTVSCHLASEEANRTQQLVHKLLLKPGLSRDLVEQLQLFSSQVSNLRVEFTTCGFFTVNTSLLCSIGGVVCTYLIILHQFR